MKGLVVLGSTGSIGTQTLDIVRSFQSEFRIVGLAARNNLDLLAKQAQEFDPRMVCFQANGGQEVTAPLASREACSMEEMVRCADVDMVMSATVGEAGLSPTLAALEARKPVILANKESVVMAGELLTGLARTNQVDLLPVDSEPSAIWQCLRGEDKEVSRLIITASGGPFRKLPLNQMADVTPEEALKHPTWRMGQRITIDSATLMNKAFEVIEAHWLFGVPWERIEVVVHPQSIIHSMVEFADGSVKAQMGPPDMRLPIQYAMFYPVRVYNESLPRFDPLSASPLTFEPLDPQRYPSFYLGLEMGKREGTWPAALCAADEEAVQMFLLGRLGFTEIHQVVQEALKEHQPVTTPSRDDILQAASWARERVHALVEA